MHPLRIAVVVRVLAAADTIKAYYAHAAYATPRQVIYDG